MTLILLVVTYLGRPMAVGITDGHLQLIRAWGSTSLPLEDLGPARYEPDMEVQAFRYRVGTGGVFGFTGTFSGPKGTADVFVTTGKGWVGIPERAGRWLYVSPRDPEAFIRRFNQAVEQVKGQGSRRP